MMTSIENLLAKGGTTSEQLVGGYRGSDSPGLFGGGAIWAAAERLLQSGLAGDQLGGAHGAPSTDHGFSMACAGALVATRAVNLQFYLGASESCSQCPARARGGHEDPIGLSYGG